MRFNQWFKLNHQWIDLGRKIIIGEYDCMLYWDAEKRHWRVELEGHGNIGRSQLSADKAIIDAKTTMGVMKEDITIPINIGDTVLGGKFKNKRIVVKNIGKNEKGDITLNGKPLMKYRIIPQEVEESMGVIYSEGMRSGPKTGKSRDFLLSRERGLTPKNLSGFANTVHHYIDPLDPRRTKERRKPDWGISNKRIVG